jgi:hypothetical protein
MTHTDLPIIEFYLLAKFSNHIQKRLQISSQTLRFSIFYCEQLCMSHIDGHSLVSAMTTSASKDIFKIFLQSPSRHPGHKLQ